MDKLIEILQKIEQKEALDFKGELESLTFKHSENKDARILLKLLNFEAINKSINVNQTQELKLLNLGCGYHYHPAWVNVDFIKTGKDVIAYDLTKGIPFEDNTFDVVYHSHLLERLPKNLAPIFIKECYRVLKPNGIIRVVVPDLEGIVKEYLRNLEAALKGDEEAKARYEWILLELFDQMVRNKSGGEMLEYWRKYPLPAEDYILRRVGWEAKINIEQIRKSGKTYSPEEYKHKPYVPINNPLEIGTFRLSGEIHQWMYDRYSLAELLRNAGFVNIEVVGADTSNIPNFNSYLLDINPNGSTRKPDSLFMEATKPSQSLILNYRFQTKKHEKVERKIESNYVPKVVHLSVWDKGGAGIAALRLHNALLRLGVDSKFLVLYKHTNNENVYKVKRKDFAKNWDWQTYASKWDGYLRNLYPNRPNDLEIFTSVDSISILKDNEFIKEADIINFHWVSSLVDFKEDIEVFKGKKIVWTLHDENAFTGGCHYTSGCNRFETECKNCPQLASTIENDLSNLQFNAKLRFYLNNDITIVTPSKWLAKQARKSKLFKENRVYTISYGLPIGIYHNYDKEAIRNILKFKQDSFLILFGAEYQNKRKGFHLLEKLIPLLPQEINGKPVELVVFGIVNKIENRGKIPVHLLGYIKEQILMAMIYSMADVFLFLSQEDNLPNTLIESILCGTPAVAFDVGGVSDIIEHKQNGWLATPFNLDEILEGIQYFGYLEKINRENISKKAIDKFNDNLQAERYLELYRSLLNNFFHSEEEINISTSRKEFDKDIILPLKTYLNTFSGLDQLSINKIAREGNTSLRDFFQLFVLYSLFSNFCMPLEVILITSQKSNLTINVPRLFKLKVFLISDNNLNIYEHVGSEENREKFLISLDKINEVLEKLNVLFGFLYLDFDNLSSHNELNSLLNVVTYYKNFYIFIEFDISKKDKLINDKAITENFSKKSFDILSKAIDEEKNKLIIERIGNREKTFVGIKVKSEQSLIKKYKNVSYIKKKVKNYPKISIVTPNLNQGEFIENCIESILSQNYPNLEYIIIDGGSTDKSIEIIKKYEKYLTYWVSEKDNGQYDAINKGFRIAKGDILAWLNADDFYLPGALFFVADFFTTFPEIQWLTTSKITNLSTENYLQANWGNTYYSYQKILDGKFDDPFIKQESTFWTKKLWELAGGYVSTNYELASDLELWCRFFRYTNLYTLSVPLAVFRFQKNSKTGKWMNKYYNEATKIILNERLLLQQKGTYTNHSSIPLGLPDLLRKGGGSLIELQIARIIEQYKNIKYKKQRKLDEIEFNDFLDELMYLQKIYLKQDKVTQSL